MPMSFAEPQADELVELALVIRYFGRFVVELQLGAAQKLMFILLTSRR